MKEIKLKINDWQDRQNIVNALANAGYKVWVKKEKDPEWKLDDEYYVIFNP